MLLTRQMLSHITVVHLGGDVSFLNRPLCIRATYRTVHFIVMDHGILGHSKVDFLSKYCLPLYFYTFFLGKIFGSLVFFSEMLMTCFILTSVFYFSGWIDVILYNRIISLQSLGDGCLWGKILKICVSKCISLRV